MSTLLNRRKFARFTVEPMYTPILARTMDQEAHNIEGYAYDLSEGGCRFDLDRALTPGTEVSMQITLPTSGQLRLDDDSIRSILVDARIVWVDTDDDAPPFRTAAIFTRFAKAQDRERLLRHISTGRYRLAG